MKIKLPKNHRITSDEYQFILQKFRGIRKSGQYAGNESWESIGYYPTIDGLIKDFIKREILLSDAQDIKQLMEDAQMVKSEVFEALRPNFDVQMRE